MRSFIAILCFTLTISTFAQHAHLTKKVSQIIEQNNKNKTYKINLILSNQVNCYALNQEFKAKKTPINLRAKKVINELTNVAKTSQQSIINFLNQHPYKVKSYKSYFIINMLVVEATADIIEQLSNFPNIDYIEEHDHFTGKPIEVIKGTSLTNKSINGAEPGLLAINADKMWAMGYTGKGTKFYSVDTGVWPTHPSIDDAWLGNYLPLNQAWHAIDFPLPTDKGNSHGTHTTGTVLGLDEANNDTIGVAFDAYFMAADPIVTNLNDIKPLPEYINVFEFALNPDGDTSTTHDIPDAINNSWGIDEHHDTSICAGYVTQMFDAIEAAGIANVFSAGNEGAGDTTIGKPQYVSTGLVNTFTVGAVNVHVSGNPIAGFSSRGPTACPASGSIAIKPEVVAPGVNVRSCVDPNNYASYQGTSMAGPHATGACLLLKQAFPNVSGEDILLALYYSAVDLGAAGEDNTYGMGMIDVFAAYNYLAQTYTPTPPNSFYYDVTIQEILNPSNNILCSQNISPSIILKNNGDSSIYTAKIEYWLNNETKHSYNWSGSLISGDTTSVNLPSITANNFGEYELFVRIDIDTNNIECDYINNQRVARFNIRPTITTLPFKEKFEQDSLPTSITWMTVNEDGQMTWDTTKTAGLPSGNYSAYMNLYDYDPRDSQKDGLVSPIITLPNQDSIFIKFDVAYNGRHSILADTLRVLISTDCGNTFTELYKKGGDTLETETTNTNDFVPQNNNQWRTDYIDITSYATNNVLIKFESINRKGNNLFLDNIWVYEGEEPVAVSNDVNIENINIYPNPTKDFITVNLKNNDIKDSYLSLYNLLGDKLMTVNLNKQKTNINLSNLSNGIYLVEFINSHSKQTHRIIKQ